MARATVATVQRLVYENLGISPDTYGTLVTNKRYKSGYIDDAIVQADIRTITLLAKNKQESLLDEILSTGNTALSGDDIPAFWHLVRVNITAGGVEKQGVEISFGLFQDISDNSGSIYDSSYRNYLYAYHDGDLYFFGTSATIYYLDLTHPTTLATLKSPTGFETALANLASAILLMKRNDNPEQAKFYMDEYNTFMQQYMIPSNNAQQEIDGE